MKKQISEYAKRKARLRKDMDRLIELRESKDVQKYFGLPVPEKPESAEVKAEKERHLRVNDIYDELGSHLGFCKELVYLFKIAQWSEYDDVPRTPWLISEIGMRLDKIRELKQEWHDLERGKPKAEQLEQKAA